MWDLDEELEAKAREIVDAGFHVHREMGPGLLERVYESALVHELTARGLPVQRQVQDPLHYLGFLMNFNVSTFKEGIRRVVL